MVKGQDNAMVKGQDNAMAKGQDNTVAKWRNKRQTMNDKIHKLNIGTFAPLVLPEVLHGDFLSEIKYLFNLEGNILHILTRNVIFFYAYSNWGELSFNIFKFFM
jgi:hypothetical protein